jgi:cytidine deaminase
MVPAEVTAAEVQKMREAAEVAAQAAYCPYSRFCVGAAVLSSEGEIFAGCNVENASFGLTICAERNAIFQAICKRHRSIRAVVVVMPTEVPAPPCGACRQVINEFGPEADIFVFGKGDQKLRFKLSELLPHPFGPNDVISGLPDKRHKNG